MVTGATAGRSHALRSFVSLLAGLAGIACASSSSPAPDGSCTRVADAPVACGDVTWLREARGKAAPTPSNEALGLAVYTCTGSARPDDAPKYSEGVPRGTICADRGAGAGADGGAPTDARTYCCTTDDTSCAYNPVAGCEPGHSGFQCLGNNRPEAFNAAVSCGNGVVQADYLNYCCSGVVEADGCTQSDTLGCKPAGLMGFVCKPGNLPKGEQLGANKSRADFYRPLCSIPSVGGDGTNQYCCYMPALVPVGGSCVQHTTVPGCAPTHFGFACYGPETPEQDYIPMRCPSPGVKGLSAEGYPATLYCCDYQ